jgi:hypothetical protein
MLQPDNAFAFIIRYYVTGSSNVVKHGCVAHFSSNAFLNNIISLQRTVIRYKIYVSVVK